MAIVRHVHVRFEARYGWTVREDDAPPCSVHPTQAAAERAARPVARRAQGRLYVHSMTNAVVRTDSYVIGEID